MEQRKIIKSDWKVHPSSLTLPKDPEIWACYYQGDKLMFHSQKQRQNEIRNSY